MTVKESVEAYLLEYGVSRSPVIIDSLILRNQRKITAITKLSFDGKKQYEEFYDGSGKPELLLNRKPIVSLDKVQILTWPYPFYQFTSNSILVDAPRGMLRIKNSVELYALYIQPVFPTGENNIIITYTAGFDTMPDDVQEALVMMVTSDALGMQAGIEGDKANLSVEGYSVGYGNPKGKYGNARIDLQLQARTLLNKYITSVIG